MIETSIIHRKRSSGLRNDFGKSSEIFGKWSEIFGKSSKTSSLLCSTQSLTSERSERVRYRVEHSKIKSVSTSGYVISSVYTTFYHAIENTINQNKGKRCIFDGVTSNLSIMHRTYVALIMLATLLYIRNLVYACYTNERVHFSNYKFATWL